MAKQGRNWKQWTAAELRKSLVEDVSYRFEAGEKAKIGDRAEVWGEHPEYPYGPVALYVITLTEQRYQDLLDVLEEKSEAEKEQA
jgi:hypothetical protein